MYDYLTSDPLKHIRDLPTNLTLEEWHRIKDEVEYQCFQHEYWYLVHPDDLEKVHSVFFEVRWGTCPCIKSSEFGIPGKVLKIRINPAAYWSQLWSR